MKIGIITRYSELDILPTKFNLAQYALYCFYSLMLTLKNFVKNLLHWHQDGLYCIPPIIKYTKVKGKSGIMCCIKAINSFQGVCTVIKEEEWPQLVSNSGTFSLKTNARQTELQMYRVNPLASASRSAAVLSLYIHTITNY